jgi:hypothetical protein
MNGDAPGVEIPDERGADVLGDRLVDFFGIEAADVVSLEDVEMEGHFYKRL